MFEFYQPKRFLKISVHAQIALVVLCYLIQIYVYYLEFKQKGTMAGYEPSVSLIFVPIYEELIFRGSMLRYFEKLWGWIGATVACSIIFGLWHVKNVFWMEAGTLRDQVLYTTFIVSPVLCLVTLKARNLWPAVILHFLNNILAQIQLRLM